MNEVGRQESPFRLICHKKTMSDDKTLCNSHVGSPETVALVGLTVDSKALLCLSLTLAQQETVIPPGLETH